MADRRGNDDQHGQAFQGMYQVVAPSTPPLPALHPLGSYIRHESMTSYGKPPTSHRTSRRFLMSFTSDAEACKAFDLPGPLDKPRRLLVFQGGVVTRVAALHGQDIQGSVEDAPDYYGGGESRTREIQKEGGRRPALAGPGHVQTVRVVRTLF